MLHSRKKLLSILLTLFIAFSCLFALTACGDESNSGSSNSESLTSTTTSSSSTSSTSTTTSSSSTSSTSTTTSSSSSSSVSLIMPIKLITPTVTLVSNTASWESDTSAEKFEISIGGVLTYLENTVTSKILNDGDVFKIRAVGNGMLYLTSDWSNVVTYSASANPSVLLAPVVSINSNGVASWSAVANAIGYKYKINDGTEQTASGLSVQLTNGQSITVKAIGDGTSYTDSAFSSSKTYTAGSQSITAPTYLGINVSSTQPTTSTTVPFLSSRPKEFTLTRSLNDALVEYYSDVNNAKNQALPVATDYDLYSSAGETIYVQIWLNNPDQCTILSLKLNGTKYQSGGALQSFFRNENGKFINCVYVQIQIPANTYDETSYKVTEIEYVENGSIGSNGTEIFIGDKDDTVEIGLPYDFYPTIQVSNIESDVCSISADITITDTDNVIEKEKGWIRAVVFDGTDIVSQQILTISSIKLDLTGLDEYTTYTLSVFYYLDTHNLASENRLSFNNIFEESFSTKEIVSEITSDTSIDSGSPTLSITFNKHELATYLKLELYNETGLIKTITGSELTALINEDDLTYQNNTLIADETYKVKVYYTSTLFGDGFKEVTLEMPALSTPKVTEANTNGNLSFVYSALIGFSLNYEIEYNVFKLPSYNTILTINDYESENYLASYVLDIFANSNIVNEVNNQLLNDYENTALYEEYTKYLKAQNLKQNNDDISYWNAKALEQKYLYKFDFSKSTNTLLYFKDENDNYYAVLDDLFTKIGHNSSYDLHFDISIVADFLDGNGEKEVKIGSLNYYDLKSIAKHESTISIEKTSSTSTSIKYTISESPDLKNNAYIYNVGVFNSDDDTLVENLSFTSSIDSPYTKEIELKWINEYIKVLRNDFIIPSDSEMLEVVNNDSLIKSLLNSFYFAFPNEVVTSPESGNPQGSTITPNNLDTERAILKEFAKINSEASIILSICSNNCNNYSLLVGELTGTSACNAVIDGASAREIYYIIDEYFSRLKNTETFSNSTDILATLKTISNSIYTDLDFSNELEKSYVYAIKTKTVTSPLGLTESYDFTIDISKYSGGKYYIKVISRYTDELDSDYVAYEPGKGQETDNKYNDSTNFTIIETLATPTNVKIEQDGNYYKLTFSQVKNATSYQILINDVEDEIINTNLRYLSNEVVSSSDVIKIIAKSEKSYFLDSDKSAGVNIPEYTLPKISKPLLSYSLEKCAVVFSAVEGAKSYVYKVNNGNEKSLLTSDELIIPVNNGDIVNVKTIPSDEYVSLYSYAESDWASLTCKDEREKLATPSGVTTILQESTYYLTWNAVTNATSYKIEITNKSGVTYEDFSFDQIKPNEAFKFIANSGSIYRICAVDSTNTYRISDWSTEFQHLELLPSPSFLYIKNDYIVWTSEEYCVGGYRWKINDGTISTTVGTSINSREVALSDLQVGDKLYVQAYFVAPIGKNATDLIFADSEWALIYTKTE